MANSYCSSVKAWVCSFLMVEGKVTLGRLTYCSPLCSNVVAYAVTDPSHIKYSTVRPQIPLSDHSHITLSYKQISSETGKQTLSSPNSISVSVNIRLNLITKIQIENMKNTFYVFESLYRGGKWDPAQETLIDEIHKLESNIKLQTNNLDTSEWYRYVRMKHYIYKI